MVAAIAFYQLPASLLLNENCFGKSYSVRFAGTRFTMLLPTIKWGEDRPWVEAPVPTSITREQLIQRTAPPDEGWERALQWGDAYGWNRNKRKVLNVRLRAVCFEFEIPAAKLSYSEYLYGLGHPTGASIRPMFAGADAWFKRLATWVEVAADQDVDVDSPIQRVSYPGQGLQIITNDGGRLSLAAGAEEILVQMDASEPLNLTRLRKVLVAANRASEPGDSHLLLKDARADLRRGRFRKAVIDAGSAVELCLADLNRNKTNVNLGLRPTLGRFVTDATIAAAAALPSTTEQDLVFVRNDAIHNNIIPTRVQTETALRLAKQIVDGVDPLGI